MEGEEDGDEGKGRQGKMERQGGAGRTAGEEDRDEEKGRWGGKKGRMRRDERYVHKGWMAERGWWVREGCDKGRDGER